MPEFVPVGEVKAAIGGVEVPPVLAGLIESNCAEFHAAWQRSFDAGVVPVGPPKDMDYPTVNEHRAALDLPPLPPEEPDVPHVVGGGT